MKAVLRITGNGLNGARLSMSFPTRYVPSPGCINGESLAEDGFDCLLLLPPDLADFHLAELQPSDGEGIHMEVERNGH